MPVADGKLKVLVFVDHDIMIRHFIHSGIFGRLIDTHDPVFVFPDAESKRRVTIDIDSLGLGDRVRRLPVSRERQPVWSKLAHVDKLRWRPGPHFAALRRLTRSAIGGGHVREFTFLALPGVFQGYRRRTLARLSSMPYLELETLIDRERPDCLVHPTVLAGSYINDLVELSRRRRIPLVAIMNSWDNAASKRAMIGAPDWLLAWGEQASLHAVRFAKVPRERVVKFGAAQFEVYREPSRLSRAELCLHHGVEPEKRLLLYAGSNMGTDEFSHLKALDDAVERGELGKTAVVYRPHPWGDCGRDGGRIHGHLWRHVVFDRSMTGYIEGVAQGRKGITTPDYRDARDVLVNVDAVISPLSTFVLESAVNGKPVMCLLPLDEGNAVHFQTVLSTIHFAEMFRMPEFLLCRGADRIVESSSDLLARVGDTAFRDRLRAAARYFVEPFDRPYGERLVEFVERVVHHA